MLLAILNDVLDLSMIEAGKVEIETIEFDLSEVVLGAHSAFTALANQKGLSFTLDVEKARGRYLGDPSRLRQILYNLISNALKFTEEGQIQVSAVQTHGRLEIVVEDTGIGIAPENMVRLFSKFGQIDSANTRRFGGTGLGLAISRELVELMGGRISVESKLGAGSRFIVGLPLSRIGDEKPFEQLAPPPTPELQTVTKQVLVAEDNSVNQLVIKTLLHQLGVSPVIVENGKAALEAWRGADWDAILMDIHMPVMDGVTATAAIRAEECKDGRARTPIIALTANVLPHQVASYLAVGMDGCVAKPVEAAVLFSAISAVVSDRPETGAASDAA